MPRSRRWADESGSASLEFLTAGLVLLVPLVYLVLMLSTVQAAALAVEGAARQGARVFAQAPDAAAGESALQRAVGVALADHGLEPDAASVSLVCAPDPGDCLHRGGTVTVSVTTTVPLVPVPAAIASDLPAAVPLQASATVPVSRFRSGG